MHPDPAQSRIHCVRPVGSSSSRSCSSRQVKLKHWGAEGEKAGRGKGGRGRGRGRGEGGEGGNARGGVR